MSWTTFNQSEKCILGSLKKTGLRSINKPHPTSKTEKSYGVLVFISLSEVGQGHVLERSPVFDIIVKGGVGTCFGTESYFFVLVRGGVGTYFWNGVLIFHETMEYSSLIGRRRYRTYKSYGLLQADKRSIVSQTKVGPLSSILFSLWVNMSEEVDRNLQFEKSSVSLQFAP